MNELRERLQHLADVGARGVHLTRPDLARPAPRQPWRTPALAGGAVAVLATAATGALIVGRHDGDDGANVVTEDGAEDFTPAAVVAVDYGFGGEATATPDDMTIRFFDADGQMFAERTWDEAYEPAPGAPDLLALLGGLLQDVPAGDLRIEATLWSDGEPEVCDQPLTATTGDRLIVHLLIGDRAEGGDVGCATTETVDQWVEGRTSGPEGESYLGLSPSEAEDRAGTQGRTIREYAVDGMSLGGTADFRCDRIDVMVFDDIVVAADLPRESEPDQCADVP